MDDWWTIFRSALLAVIIGASAGGCADTTEPSSPEERFDQGSNTQVSDPIEFLDLSQESFEVRGETSIRSIVDSEPEIFGSEEFENRQPPLVWYGYNSEDPIPTGRTREFNKVCDPNFGNRVFEMESLPATIEGIVTLYPEQYENVGICGEDQRFYGSYVLQDETGAIKILKDTEIADFDVGDRVRLRVLGVQKSFDAVNVIAFDNEEVVAEAGEQGAPGVPYQTADKQFYREFGCRPDSLTTSQPQDFGKNFRISGRICQPPTNRNFGQMTIQQGDAQCDETVRTSWDVALTADLNRRALDIKRNDLVTVTGPVYGSCNFGIGLEMLVTTPGQFQQFQ
jgi:hypothetical protein